MNKLYGTNMIIIYDNVSINVVIELSEKLLSYSTMYSVNDVNDYNSINSGLCQNVCCIIIIFRSKLNTLLLLQQSISLIIGE